MNGLNISFSPLLQQNLAITSMLYENSQKIYKIQFTKFIYLYIYNIYCIEIFRSLMYERFL